ncbi:CDP-diacylglycerol--serine O-phosphatidyltransferase [Candidatus Dependentiae bacterium]
MVFSKRLRRNKGNYKIRRKILLKKGLSFIPHIFTLGNAFFGFSSVILASQGHLFSAAYFIFLGALMDALDGRIARLLGNSSEFGIQLDSLSDAISFCFAPAFLVYFWQLKSLGCIGIILCGIFLMAGLMRLARFNIISEKQTIFFLGLPTTIAGCFLTIVLLNTRQLVGYSYFILALSFLVLILAFLMVSSVPFPTFKRKLFSINKNLYVVSGVILFAFIAVMQFHKVLLLLFILYFLSSFLINVRFKNKKGR